MMEDEKTLINLYNVKRKCVAAGHITNNAITHETTFFRGTKDILKY